MINDSELLNALVGIIAGGHRKKVNYIKQQALVSALYPLSFGGDTLVTSDSFYEFGFTYVKPPTVIDSEVESLALIDGFYNFLLKTTLVEESATDSLNMSDSFYGFTLKQTKVSIFNQDYLIADNQVYAIRFLQAGVYTDTADTLIADNEFYEFYLGSP